MAGGSLLGVAAFTASPMLMPPVGCTFGGAGWISRALMRVTICATVAAGKSSRFINGVPILTILRNGAEVTTGGFMLLLIVAAAVRLSDITRCCMVAVIINARSAVSDALELT